MTTMVGLRITKAMYPILLERAQAGEPITYGALTDELKQRHPDDKVIANVIPRSLGKRLLLLRRFTTEQGYPDLSSLVINAGTGEVGEAYSEEFDAAEQRERIRMFDWTQALPEFDFFIDDRAQEVTMRNRQRRTREQAKDVLWKFAKENPTAPLPSTKQREAVILILIDGEVVEEAIAEVLAL